MKCKKWVALIMSVIMIITCWGTAVFAENISGSTEQNSYEVTASDDESSVEEEKEYAVLQYGTFSKSYNESTVKKSSKSFRINAETDAGEKLTYSKVSGNKKITVSKAGKVTIKEGLKSGTYKVKITIKSHECEGYYATAFKKTLTIKIKKPAKKTSSGGGTVYWVASGKVYHTSRNCPTLKRSRTVYSGSISKSGKSRACKVCS